ncbi:hypothetical protein Leryth_017617 [Lithospermum erythrorhizon]|nr:hypothetical protein Leryth_017617 [Lithospermum erythrorhizon]
MFGEGKEVEVSINIKPNQDVWYPATIVENHADSSFLVEYKLLKEGTEEIEPRKVTVDCSCIRPSPPPLKDRCFDLLEKVDAFHELGWWSGLVTKELPDNRYNVFFQSTKGVGEFDLVHVRPQLNWKDGKWFLTSSQEEVTPCQENCGGLVDNELYDISSGRTIRTCKTKVSLKGKKMKQKACISRTSRESNPSEILSNNSPCTPKGILAGRSLEETEFPSSSLIKNQTGHVDMDHEKSHGVASSPKRGKHTMKVNMHLAKKLKRGGGAVTPSCTSSQQNTTVSDKQNGGINCTSDSPPSNSPGDHMLIDLTSRDDEPSDNRSPGTRTAKRRKTDPKENHTLSFGRKQGQAGEEGNNGLTKGLECSKLSGSEAAKACPNNDERCLQLEWDQEKQLNNLPEQDKGDQSEAGKSSQKRKRGRPVKVSGANTNAKMKENSPMPIGDCEKLVCAELNCRNDSGSTTRNSSLKPTDSNDHALISEHKRQMSKKAKQRTTSENKISQISDSSDGTMAKTTEPFCITKEVTRTVQQEHGMLDDQPLSTWVGKQTSGSVNSSTQGASTAMMVEQSTIELRQTRTELNGQTTFVKDSKTVPFMDKEADGRSLVLVDGDTSITTADEPELPFVKCSSLWKAVESMEAFCKIPQNPHFRPLQQYKESLREGFAIAFMVNFSSVVEKISMLRFDDTKEKIDDILDSLKDLETHGFDVQVLRDRITELESIKEDHKKLSQEVDVINKQIVSCKFDKLDQDKEIMEVSKQIKELQLRKTRAEIIKDAKDHEIKILQSKLEDAEEAIGSARNLYEGLASGVL